MSLIHEALEKKIKRRPFDVQETTFLEERRERVSPYASFSSGLSETRTSKQTSFMSESQWILYGMISGLVFLSALYFFTLPLYNQSFKKEMKLLKTKSVSVSRVVPETSSRDAHPSFTLTGITRDGKEWTAIVNNRLVRVGDRVSGAEIKLIQNEEVLLDYRGETISLILY